MLKSHELTDITGGGKRTIHMLDGKRVSRSTAIFVSLAATRRDTFCTTSRNIKGTVRIVLSLMVYTHD